MADQDYYGNSPLVTADNQNSRYSMNPRNFAAAQWENLGPTGQAAGMFGGAMGLMSMLGRRQGPSRYEVEQEGIGRGLMGASDAYSGQLGSLGMNLQNRGMQNMDMYRDRYMDAMMDPNNQIYDMGQLAAADTNRMRGISQRVGLMGGGLKASQLNAAGYNPGVGSGTRVAVCFWEWEIALFIILFLEARGA